MPSQFVSRATHMPYFLHDKHHHPLSMTNPITATDLIKGWRKKRKRQQTAMDALSSRLLRLVLVSFVMMSSSCRCCCHGQEQQPTIYAECYRHLMAADSDQNQRLTSAEYAQSIQDLTYGAIDKPFASLGNALQDAFTTRESTQGTTSGINVSVATSATSTIMTTLCRDIYQGVLDELGIVLDTKKCFLFLSIGDQNRNNALQKEEFPRFANAMAGDNQYGASITFELLPVPLHHVFSDFADQTINAIDVTGTRPGTQPANDQRNDMLTSLCRQTLVAVAAGNAFRTMVPTLSPAGSTDWRFCKTAMLAADFNRNKEMDAQDYTKFINILSANSFPMKRYDQLPSLLQDNFIMHTNDMGVIDIHGARPGATTWPSNNDSNPQEEYLRAFCQATTLVLQEAKSLAPKPTPTLAPTPGQVQAYPFVKCTRSMVSADRDRSNSLSSAEYILFLNILESFAWKDFEYQDLPQPLRENYDALSSSSSYEGSDSVGIAVTGSFPGQPPSPQQQAFLEKICHDTAMAADAALYPGKYNNDFLSPLGGNETATVNVTMYNAFVISTRSDSNETLLEALAKNSSLSSLESAYGAFVNNVVENFQSTTQTRTKYNVIDATEELYLFESVDCPYQNDTQSQDCQIVYGLFDLNAQNVADTTLLVDELTLAIQSSLNETKSNGLQSLIDKGTDSSLPILVVGIPENGQVRPLTPTPTMAPSVSSPLPKDEKDGGGGAGTLVVGVLAGVVLFGAIIYYFWDIPAKFLEDRRRKKEMAGETGDTPNAVTTDLTKDEEEAITSFPKRVSHDRDFGGTSSQLQERHPDDHEEDKDDPFRRRHRETSFASNPHNDGYGDSDSCSGSRNSERSDDYDGDSYGSDYDDEY